MDASDPRKRQLALLSVCEFLGMSLWFSASAVAPRLAEPWNLTAREAGWLSSSVQLGFVFGTAVLAVSNLADLVPPRRLFSASALLGALANAGVAAADGFAPALALRFLTGAFLAGVYPPAMKMAATWFRTSRGLAIGVIVGALTCGKAVPYLLRGGSSSAEGVILTASALAVAAAVLIFFSYRDGPHAFERRPFRLTLAADVLRHRETRLAILGYLGHMWELYAMWVWAPVFVAASLAARGEESAVARDLFAFLAIASGAAGCVLGGLRADRVGRERLVVEAMAVSASCSVLAGAFFAAPLPLLLALLLAWGFSVVADSAQFSTLVTEVCPRHAVGTALTLMTSLGFLLTVGTIELLGFVHEWLGWRLAFPILAVGPALGIAAIRRLRRSPDALEAA